MILEGKAHKFGRNVDTDVIIPARYLNVSDPAELARHVMEGLDRDFARKVKEGDMIVAGENFGCGSSREHAPLAIKALGISCIISKTFARIFYRNSINIGLPILECVEAVDNIKEGDVLRVELGTGTIINVSTGKSFQSQPFPEFMQQIIEAGGLIEYVKAKRGARKARKA
jgi:3-isopropylmalate/(R)-2-methylmalate dehydratase small subunit